MSMKLAKLYAAQNKKLNRAQILALSPPIEYNDGRTKQAFKDETDINIIMKRAQVTGTISHINKHEARYGDFADFDFFEHALALNNAQNIFDDLPPEIRQEFHNQPQEFFEHVNHPDNVNAEDYNLKALAAPGRQNLSTVGNIGADAEAAALAAAQPLPAPTPTASAENQPAASNEPATPSADP